MNDQVRGFPAFPKQRAGARFATSWWGRAWIKALEDTSLDQTLLTKGRSYAKTGQVATITVSPGRIAAPVQGQDVYTTVVYVTQLTDAEWGRFLDQVAAKAGHIAALLDGDMPSDLVEAAEDAGVPLLPSVGDLEPDCDCPDWGHPCKHAAALCYQASWLLDADPFVLLLMRGRGKQELLRELQSRQGAGAPAAVAAVQAGTPVPVAYALGLPPLPAPPPLPEAFAPLVVEPAPGVDPAALALLAADAAGRARELLVSGRLAVLAEHQDAVRLAAAHPGARREGLERAVEAWRYGGADGLEVLESAWTPSRQDLSRARSAWEEGQSPQLWRNRWTIGDQQVRYGRDGRWYPYVSRAGEWWPAGPPERDPVAALTIESPMG